MSKCEFSVSAGPAPFNIGIPQCHVHNCTQFFDTEHCLWGMILELRERIEKLESKANDKPAGSN